jgi:hypothetical protein
MLNRMSYDNFRWFLHVLLFMHARKLDERIQAKVADTTSGRIDPEDVVDEEDDVEAFGDF